jgi:hypothetical protein
MSRLLKLPEQIGAWSRTQNANKRMKSATAGMRATHHLFLAGGVGERLCKQLGIGLDLTTALQTVLVEPEVDQPIRCFSSYVTFPVTLPLIICLINGSDPLRSGRIKVESGG